SGMRKVKDSYNCDMIALAAADAALKDQAWMLENRRKILATRSRLETELKTLGFVPVPSQTNFVWATHAEIPHSHIYQELKQRKILIRYMKFPNATAVTDVNPEGILDGLRITV